MKYDTVITITNSYAIDFEAPGAAMRLAWKWTAQELWSARKFGTDHSAIFAKALRTAWMHVKMVRDNRRRARMAEGNERIRQLNEERKMLQNKSFRLSIGIEQDRIDAEIRSIIDSM